MHHNAWISTFQHLPKNIPYLDSHDCGRSIILHRLETKISFVFKKGFEGHRATARRKFDVFDVFLGDDESSDGRELHLVPFSSYL